MKEKSIFGFDFEVFKFDWLVVFINKYTQKKYIISNDVNELKSFYSEHKDDIFVGYNSRNYDQFIFKGILDGKNPFDISEQLIIYRKSGYQVIRNNRKYPLNNYDVGDIQHSLKQYEAFMGSTIKESSVDFNINRKLTSDEMDETIKYCIHDVEECLKVLEYKISDFDSQLSLIEAFDLSFEMFNKTKAQLSAHILGAVKQHTFDDEFEITIPDTLQLSEKYQYIADWYKNPKNLSYKTPLYSYEKGHKRSLDTVVAGVPHTFAWGGVHGAIPNYKAEGIILCADVASLYPSIMIEYDCQSRKLMNPEKYKLIRDERLELKRKKDSRQQPYKIVLNSTYGILKDRNNPLYDPLMSNNVCVTGQLLLLDLIEKLEPYGKLIQSNTDGIYMLVDTMETVDKIKTVASEWEKRTRLDLEWDIYNKIYQKDVNNYIIIDSNGHHKAKGAYVKELSSIDYDLPIINTALIRYFVNNTPIEDTVNSCSNLIEFQKVVKLTALYKGVIYGEGIKEKQEDGTIKTKVKDGKMLREKVHRVFASKNEHAKGIYKIKTEKGKEVYEKMTNTPERCFIDNDDMTGKTIPEELDKEYYISLANERLSQFLEVSEEVINEVPEILYNILISSNSFYDFLKKCDKNDKTKVKLKYFRDYIIADCCNVFGKTKKLLDFIEYYLLLNNKSSITKASLDKKVICDKIKTIILVHSELNKTGKTYTIDSETILYEIFECLSNDSIHLSEILEKQVELFEEVRYVDSTLEDNIYYVLNTRNEIAPNVILYRLKDGVIENRKIDKQSFLILSLQDGDIIKVNSSELRYGQKAVGKNSDGTNIVENDITREFDVILNYDVLYRNYNKSNTLLSEED